MPAKTTWSFMSSMESAIPSSAPWRFFVITSSFPRNSRDCSFSSVVPCTIVACSAGIAW